jgi:hypothetical protein
VVSPLKLLLLLPPLLLLVNLQRLAIGSPIPVVPPSTMPMSMIILVTTTNDNRGKDMMIREQAHCEFCRDIVNGCNCASSLHEAWLVDCCFVCILWVIVFHVCFKNQFTPLKGKRYSVAFNLSYLRILRSINLKLCYSSR